MEAGVTDFLRRRDMRIRFGHRWLRCEGSLVCGEAICDRRYRSACASSSKTSVRSAKAREEVGFGRREPGLPKLPCNHQGSK